MIDTNGDVADSHAANAWEKFRRTRGWVQALAWFGVFPIPLFLYARTRPLNARKPWYVASGVAAVVWLAIAAGSNGGSGPETLATSRVPTTVAAEAADDAKSSSTTTAAPTATTTAAPTTTTTTAAPTTTTAAPPASLGMSPQSFVHSWNVAATDFGNPKLQLSAPNIESGAVHDTFTEQLSNSVAVVGTVNKNGTMREMTVLAQPGGDAFGAIDTLSAIGMLIQTVSPELGANARGDVLSELGLLEAPDLRDYEARAVRGNIEYVFQASDIVGIFFIASPVNL